MADEKRAIRDMVATWMKASEAGDLSTVLSLMADDVIFMTPDREPFGKDAFRAASEAMKNVSLRERAISAKSRCLAIGPISETTLTSRLRRPAEMRCGEKDTRSRSSANKPMENGCFGETRI
jgi:uncharacterized protein (TIGR02246 family)